MARASTTGVRLPLTIREAAELWGVARSVVRKWIAQGRVKYETRGGGAERPATILIYQAERPPRLTPGGLTAAQRAGWQKSKREVA